VLKSRSNDSSIERGMSMENREKEERVPKFFTFVFRMAIGLNFIIFCFAVSSFFKLIFNTIGYGLIETLIQIYITIPIAYVLGKVICKKLHWEN
jgi:ABC-type spermidine/putrescine transport system permease subunit I